MVGLESAEKAARAGNVVDYVSAGDAVWRARTGLKEAPAVYAERRHWRQGISSLPLVAVQIQGR